MLCAPFLMFFGPDGTGCDGVSFPVHDVWDSREVSVAGMSNSVRVL